MPHSKKVSFFLLGLFAVSMFGSVTAPISAAQKPRPNVLLIMTDDQGYGDLSLHGNTILQTPNLDKLGKQSIRFDRFYVSPVCAPTRASLLTGRYSLRTGVWGVTHGKETMRANEVTLAELLRAAGYRTALFGKWHNGEHFPYTPNGQGFEEFFGFHNGHWNNYFNAVLEKDNKATPTKGYITDVLTGRAMKFLERNKSRPFFCYVAYNAPHTPYQVSDKYFDHFKKKGLDAGLACIYGMCANLDDNIGRLLAKLDELKLAENTIVIFLTDNGANSVRFNAGMRGRKGSVHEGGSRVPFFVRYPARFPVEKNAKLIPNIAAHIDVLPTVAELCGAAIPKKDKLDGKSLVPLLEGRQWPERLLFNHRVRGTVNMFPGAVRSQRYRLVHDGKKLMLFDMKNDPGEAQNIVAKAPGVRDKLLAAYKEWYRDVTKQPLVRMPIPVGYKQENPVVLPAPQAHLKDAVFFGRNGFANDWITGWKSTTAQIHFELDVIQPGKYDVSLGYLCPAKDAGSKIEVAIGAEKRYAKVRGTPIVEIPLPHRMKGNNWCVNMEWRTLPIGEMRLAKGPARLVIRATETADGQVMDLKNVKLRRVD